MSATGSPHCVLVLSNSKFAPICLQTRKIPSRVGLIPTFLIKSSEPGIKSPAAMKNAAEEISPGTSTF